MITTYRKLLSLLTMREKRRLVLVFLGVLGRALLEVLGVASILPFLSVIGDPDLIHQNGFLNWLFMTLGFRSINRFLLFLGALVLVVLVSTNLLAALVDWALYRFTWMRNHSLSRRLFSAYLARPYTFFLAQNSATLQRNVLTEVRHVIDGVIVPGLNVLAGIAVIVLVLAFLLRVNPVLGATAFAVVGVAYGSIFLFVRQRLRRLGQIRAEADRQRFKISDEAFSLIKFLKLAGRMRYFLDQYAKASYKFSSAMAAQMVMNYVPRYALDAVAFGGFLLVVLYLLATRQDLGQVLPLAGVLGVAGYRLLPAFQRVFSGITQVRFFQAALDVIYSDLQTSSQLPPSPESIEPLPLREKIELRNVSFAYPGSDQPVLANISLVIPAGASVAFVGKTGAGKTTLVDVILGLIRPDEGGVYVDGQEITDDLLPHWQRNLGYVPQDIYLLDDTVAANIAFGVPKEKIDMDVVIRAARIARIHDFVMTLPQGYNTLVGERGVRLSGGERQRIGIARALYHNPQVLVLDEATSALDIATQYEVFQAITTRSPKATTVVVAHRLEVAKFCDLVYLIDQGRVVNSGKYQDLLAHSQAFKTLTEAQDREARIPDERADT